jgi:putative two-component system hydrogenase maturation factor HypX/HoxX
LDQLSETRVFLHNACAERELKGRPGDIIATASNGAICRATIDGAVWIGHVQNLTQAAG